MIKKSKIITFTIIGILALFTILASLIFVIFLRPITIGIPDAPTLSLTNSRIYLTTNKVEEAQNYMFRFISPNNNTIKFISSTPSLYIDFYNSETKQYLSDFYQAGIYEVKCCAIGGNNNSGDYSLGTTFERYIQLDKPSMNLYEENLDRILQWGTIQHANRYDIYFTSANYSTQVYEHTASLDDFQFISLSSIMTTLKLSNGEYQISIVAKNTENVYFTESLFSTPITFIY